MRLGELRLLIKEYDDTFYSRKYWYGDHKRATILKNFVNLLYFYGDEYHLNSNEEFSLAKILSSMKDDLLLVKFFKSQFKDSTDFFKLFSFLQLASIQDELLIRLLTISPLYYTKLLSLAENLEEHNLLSDETVQNLFTLLSQKIPRPVEDNFVIESQNDAGLSWSVYKAMGDDFQLYVKQEPDKVILSERRSSILQGTLSQDDTTPKYLIKKFKGHDAEHVNKEAMKEVKYARFLGRTARFFQYDKQWQVISEWQTGKSLNHISPADFMAISIKMRIKSLIPTLQELAKLHSQFRVHGDIKGANCVFNISSMQMKLIDFESTRKVKPKKYSLPTTYTFLDKHLRQGVALVNCQVNYSFCDDIYSLGFLVAAVFPEIYKVTIREFKTEVNLQKPVSSLSFAEKSIYYLVSSMLSDNRNARCTAKIALEYCQVLFNDFDNINQQCLGKIMEKTLNKAQFSFDDIINDHNTLAPICMM